MDKWCFLIADAILAVAKFLKTLIISKQLIYYFFIGQQDSKNLYEKNYLYFYFQ